MISILTVLYLLLVIQPHDTLRCYLCRGIKQCGLSFSTQSNNMKFIDGNDLYDSCSITASPNGLTIRSVIPSDTCRSSSYQFCCNQDLCNSLPSPPLPALTNLKCPISNCRMNEDQKKCSNSVIHLSSATESCIRIHGKTVYKSYQVGCSPNNRTVTSLKKELITQQTFCFNSPEQLLRPGDAIRCYTCDSRITGLEDCSQLNTSSSHVHNSGSSNPSESCAIIAGLAGKDLVTGKTYPAFTIRTFIYNCVNQSFGDVTYGGATFQGRIDCCSMFLCNTKTLTLPTTKHVYSTTNSIVFILVVCLGLIFIIIGITLSIHRFRLKKCDNQYSACVISDGVTVLFLSPS